MSKHKESSLFIRSSFKQAAGFYQHLLSGITTYEALGNRVLRLVRTARAFRQTEKVRELSNILIGTPIREYQVIGQYHLVWCEFRESKCNVKTLETVIDRTQTYKSKALITRATFELYGGNCETALYFYSEALTAHPTMSDYIVASRGIALVKSIEGFHASALKDLERLVPLLAYAGSVNYCDVLNSYAVELLAANRLSEAENLSRAVVSSPFAPYYPEWRETHNEAALRRPSRSVIAFSRTIADEPEARNLIRMPLAKRSASSEPFTAGERATVLDMGEWKKRMTKQAKKPWEPATSEDRQARLTELKKLSSRDVLVQIMYALGDERVSDDQLLKALIVLEELEPSEAS